MAKSRTYRRPLPYSVGHVRIITSVDDTTGDWFTTEEMANIMLGKGELRPVDLGPDYPNSFMEK